jgi:hypothetical protein
MEVRNILLAWTSSWKHGEGAGIRIRKLPFPRSGYDYAFLWFSGAGMCLLAGKSSTAILRLMLKPLQALDCFSRNDCHGMKGIQPRAKAVNISGKNSFVERIDHMKT